MEVSDSSEFPSNSVSSGNSRPDESSDSSCLSSSDSARSSRSSTPELPSDLSQDKMGNPYGSRTFLFQIGFTVGLGQLGHFKPAGTMITPG